MSGERKFWETKTLQEMSKGEWESLCDGCGRCCLVKLQDDEDDQVYYTNVVCDLFVEDTCRCSHYSERHERVPDCIRFDAAAVTELGWLPTSCAYRRLSEGRGLADWHPLISGTKQTVHDASISIKGQVIPSGQVDPDDLEEFIVRWVDF